LRQRHSPLAASVTSRSRHRSARYSRRSSTALAALGSGLARSPAWTLTKKVCGGADAPSPGTAWRRPRGGGTLGGGGLGPGGLERLPAPADVQHLGDVERPTPTFFRRAIATAAHAQRLLPARTDSVADEARFRFRPKMYPHRGRGADRLRSLAQSAEWKSPPHWTQTPRLVPRWPHAQPFEMRGRTTRGWVRVDPEGLRNKHQLERWVKRGVAYARSLPPKR